MDFNHISEALTDERCGLFFLAGLDQKRLLKPNTLTIHAAEGTLSPDNIRFMEASIASVDPDIRIRTRLHSRSDLNAPDSLGNFARTFRHDHILSDPTGAFARVTKLLALARAIRTEMGRDVSRLLWQAEVSRLVVVTATDATGRRDSDHSFLEGKIEGLVANGSCPDLKKVIRSIQVTTSAPQSRYTAIDSGSVAAGNTAGLGRIVTRASGLAALIGLGALSAAHASVPANSDDGGNAMPGVTGLVGLTTLGENSFGVRNRFQAAGGLRLYFGPSAGLMASVISPAVPCVADCAVEQYSEELDVETEAIPQQSAPAWPKPSRIQYGT